MDETSMPDPVTLEDRVLPIFPYGANKRPTSPHGFKDATSDPATIDRLWGLYPGPLVGVPMGPASGLVALDIDTRRDGEAWLAEFEATHGFPSTRIHATRSGGLHFIFQHRPGLRTHVDLIAPGVEVRAEGAGIVWWPSAGYRVLCSGPVAPWPALLDWALEEASMRKRQTFVTGRDGVVTPTLLPSEGPIKHGATYATTALGNAYSELRTCDYRRNHLLNVLAYKMGRLVARGWIERGRVEGLLLHACKRNGLIDDPDDGEVKCRATLRSGLEAGLRMPYGFATAEGERWVSPRPTGEEQELPNDDQS
jgi:hypothetical protein